MKNILQFESHTICFFPLVFTLSLVVSQPLNLCLCLFIASCRSLNYFSCSCATSGVSRETFWFISTRTPAKLKKGFERLQHFKCCSLRVSLAGSETSFAVILRRIAFQPKAKVRPPAAPLSKTWRRPGWVKPSHKEKHSHCVYTKWLDAN